MTEKLNKFVVQNGTPRLLLTDLLKDLLTGLDILRSI